MYIYQYIKEEHIEDILKFRRNYCTQNIIDKTNLKNDIKYGSYDNQYSRMVFVKGELKAYILFKNHSYHEELRENIYIIDEVFCSNPKYLYILISTLTLSISNFLIRYNEYSKKMIRMLESKNIAKIVNNTNGLILLKSLGMRNIKSVILYLLTQSITSVDGLINELLLQDFELDNIIKHKRFILTQINHYNRDKHTMIGNSLNTLECEIKPSANTKKAIKKYIESGYSNDIELSNFETSKFINHIKYVCANSSYKYGRSVCIYRSSSFPLLEPMYSDKNVSYYRGVVNRRFKFYRKNNKNLYLLYIYDKYGLFLMDIAPLIMEQKRVSIPYNCSNTFDYAINNILYKYKLNTFISDLSEKYPELNNESKGYFKTLVLKTKTVLGIKTSDILQTKIIEVIEKNISDMNSAIHDYTYPRIELLESETLVKAKKMLKKYIKNFNHPFLTSGALSNIVLNYSTNKIMRINRYSNLLSECLVKNSDIKLLRKQFSNATKKNDLDLFETILNTEIERCQIIWKKTLKLKKDDYELLNIFIKRMNVYSGMVNLKQFYSNFKEQYKQIIRNEYPGLFKSDIIEMDYEDIGTLIADTLNNNKGNRKIRKLYTALNTIQNIKDIMNGNIVKENYKLLVNELKQRNINISKSIEIADRFEAKIEQKCSPEFLVAGDASVCCMSYGTDKAKTYALEEGFGIINIYYKTRIIANSLIWINEPYNCLVIDNIEVAPNYKKTCFIDNISKLYLKTIRKVLKEYKLSYAVQGRGYNDLKLYDESLESIKMAEFKPVRVRAKRFYSDARNVFPVAVNKTQEEILTDIEKVNNYYEKKNKDGIIIPSQPIDNTGNMILGEVLPMDTSQLEIIELNEVACGMNMDLPF